MSEAELLQRIRALEARIGRTEVQERPLYATGSWTPTLVGQTTAGSFVYGALNGASYTRIGNRVFFNGRCQISAITVAAVGAMYIAGLPFIAANPAHGIPGGAAIIAWNGINLAAGYTFVGGQGFYGAGFFLIESGDNVGYAYVQGGEIGAAFDIWFQGQYQV